jgi:predicted nucleic acid-binding protein
MAVAYLLDTNAVLYLLRGELAKPLLPGTYYLSVISELELLSYGGITDAEQEAIQEFLDSVCVVELSSEVRRLAIQLRRQHGLKLPDAIIAATALAKNVPLLTNDKKLVGIDSIETESLELRGN